MSTYTNRRLDLEVVDRIDDNGVHFRNSWSFWPGQERSALLEVGREYLFECQGFNTPTGMATLYRDHHGDPVVDQWLWHRTDEEIADERQAWLDKIHREREEQWVTNEADWRRREATLPLSLRRRLERFRTNGGHGFETDGWGYELVCCELAVLYAESAQEDTDAINAYAREHGTSGNQHDYAKALSRHLTDDPTDEDVVANSVSALSPITGDADYSDVNA